MHQPLRDYMNALGDVSDSEFRDILSFFKSRQVAKRKILWPQKEVCEFMYFVETGCIRMFYQQPDGQEATRYIAVEKNFGTALASFVSNTASAESVQAVEDSTILEIGRTDFYNLLNKYPIWQKVFQNILEKAIVTATFRMETFLTLDAQKRYQWMLEKHPDFRDRFSTTLLSSYLGISRETLSRLQKKV
jgi:CRP-like cAMP-binding protein